MFYLMVRIRQISDFLLLQECFVYGNEFHHRTSLVTMYLFEQYGGLGKQCAKLVAQFHLFSNYFRHSFLVILLSLCVARFLNIKSVVQLALSESLPKSGRIFLILTRRYH